MDNADFTEESIKFVFSVEHPPGAVAMLANEPFLKTTAVSPWRGVPLFHR